MDRLYLLSGRLDSLASNPVAKALQFEGSQEGLFGVDPQASLAKPCQDSLEFFQVVIEVAFGDAEKAIDVGLCEVEALEDFAHLFLKDVG